MERTDVLSGLTARQAMRRRPVNLWQNAVIEQAIRYTIKYKVDAVLVTGDKQEAVGVVSKTDIMGAYYAGIPLTAPLRDIMASPPRFCRPHDPLDSVLDTMRSGKVQRLYVLGGDPHIAIGVVAYADIVGLLYRYCHKCERSVFRSREDGGDAKIADQFKVCEVMSRSVRRHREDDSLLRIMEAISLYRHGTVLIKSADDRAVGAVSRSDLIMAYKHGISPGVEASSIMSAPVRTCSHDEPLIIAIHKMIFSDTHYLYVHKDDPQNIVGLISLADAARVRSGSCRACMPSRIHIEVL